MPPTPRRTRWRTPARTRSKEGGIAPPLASQRKALEPTGSGAFFRSGAARGGARRLSGPPGSRRFPANAGTQSADQAWAPAFAGEQALQTRPVSLAPRGAGSASGCGCEASGSPGAPSIFLDSSRSTSAIIRSCASMLDRRLWKASPSPSELGGLLITTVRHIHATHPGPNARPARGFRRAN